MVISTIITFNYDRSLEHYLTETTKRSYEGQVRERALQKLERLNVIHVHGQLGAVVPYKPERSTEKLKEAAQEIRMIHDSDIDESEGQGPHLRKLMT